MAMAMAMAQQQQQRARTRTTRAALFLPLPLLHLATVLAAAAALACCFSLLTPTPTLASPPPPPSRSPPASARSYAHLSSSSLLRIPSLSDPSPILDHRLPSSFLSKILIPRVSGSDSILTVQRAILDVFTRDLAANAAHGRTGWHVEEHAFSDKTPYGVKPFRNLVFTKDPRARNRLVVAAHYDSKYFRQGGFVGATDSAAPCAMLVDLAHALDGALEKAKAKGEDTTLQLIFFDGEEAFKVWTHTDSTYGSRALAQNWSVTYDVPQPQPHLEPQPRPRRLTENTPIRKIDAMEHLVLLDLLGARDPVIPSFFSSTHWLFQELVSAEERLRGAGLLYPASELSTTEAARRRTFFQNDMRSLGSGGIEDDHLPFLAHGVPVLHVIPSPFPRVWHTMKDDASALDYPTDYAWAMILRTFVAEYLRLDLEGVPPASREDLARKSQGGNDNVDEDEKHEEEEEEEGWGSASAEWIRGAEAQRVTRHTHSEEDLASINGIVER